MIYAYRTPDAWARMLCEESSPRSTAVLLRETDNDGKIAAVAERLHWTEHMQRLYGAMFELGLDRSQDVTERMQRDFHDAVLGMSGRRSEHLGAEDRALIEIMLDIHWRAEQALHRHADGDEDACLYRTEDALPLHAWCRWAAKGANLRTLRRDDIQVRLGMLRAVREHARHLYGMGGEAFTCTSEKNRAILDGNDELKDSLLHLSMNARCGWAEGVPRAALERAWYQFQANECAEWTDIHRQSIETLLHQELDAPVAAFTRSLVRQPLFLPYGKFPLLRSID